MTTRKPSEKDFWVCHECGSPVIATEKYNEDLDVYIRRGICSECGLEVRDIVEEN